jgi:hypothetical protein
LLSAPQVPSKLPSYRCALLGNLPTSNKKDQRRPEKKLGEWGRLTRLFVLLFLCGKPPATPKWLNFQLKEKGYKMRKETKFTKDIRKALKAEMVRIGHEEGAVDYVLSRYDFDSYLLEGTLSHIDKEIYAVESAVN